MLPQAPEFDRFLRPCPIGQPHAGCTMGPGLRRDGVICSEGAMKANWVTASEAGAYRSAARAHPRWEGMAIASRSFEWWRRGSRLAGKASKDLLTAVQARFLHMVTAGGDG